MAKFVTPALLAAVMTPVKAFIEKVKSDLTVLISGKADSSALENYQPKGDYATKSEIPTDNNTLANGAGYITEDALEGYAKSSDVEQKIQEATGDIEVPEEAQTSDIQSILDSFSVEG